VEGEAHSSGVGGNHRTGVNPVAQFNSRQRRDGAVGLGLPSQRTRPKKESLRSLRLCGEYSSVCVCVGLRLIFVFLLCKTFTLFAVSCLTSCPFSYGYLHSLNLLTFQKDKYIRPADSRIVPRTASLAWIALSVKLVLKTLKLCFFLGRCVVFHFPIGEPTAGRTARLSPKFLYCHTENNWLQ
jgi:hypothetical protein